MNPRNTEPYLSSYLHSKGARLGLPISGTFELTARCNFNCPMCYVHLKQEDIDAQGRELTTQQWIDLAQKARDRGMVFALLTGGEPFVRKDFFEIYSALKDMGVLVSINSNGSMLEGEIRQKLLENPPFRINVSLYGGCEETYRNMCGQNSFQRVVSNIRALKEGGIDVRLNLSITPYNQQDIEKIYAISRELGVHVKGTSYMYPPIRVNGQQFGIGNRLSAEEAAKCGVRWDQLRFTQEEFTERAHAVKKLQAVEIGECSMDLDEGVSCRAGSTSFWMTWDGRMMPCGMMPWPVAHPLEDGFDAAWDTIRQETKKLRLPAKCGACPKRKVCALCAAVCVTETGAYDQVPDYVCRMTDALIEETWNAYKERNPSNED